MTKNKTFIIFIAALILSFNINNLSFASEALKSSCRYPDYANEFCGRDKFESFNRKIYVFNSKLNKYVIRPVNIVWASVMPQYGMDRVQSFYTNLEYPIRLASCLLQKDFKSSKTETIRFLTNTTMGVAGLWDPAKTRFKIEPRQEDMGQVLAHYKVKKGPYLVLPVIPPGCIRDLGGQLLDCPLNPTSYIIGPIALAAKSISLINKTTVMQSLLKAIDYNYADPYEITKKLCAVERYIKNANLDRREVLEEKMAAQKILEVNAIDENADKGQTGAACDISNISNTIESKTVPDGNLKAEYNCELKADIELENYNSQGPLVDSMRTAMFENQKISDCRWSELSVWNKTFAKQIKTLSVNIDSNHPNYKYRYILQKNKAAPLAIIYPSFGEGIMSHHSIVLAKVFYDEGYSVVIQGSPFQWEFAKCMPDDYRPGFPVGDTHYSRLITSKIIKELQSKNGCIFDKKILVGTSFGALTTLFVAAKEEEENILGITNYISINPPIEIFFALKQLDKYSQEWKNNPDDIKMRVAITAGKVLQVLQTTSGRSTEPRIETLPFTDDEAKLVIGFIMKQKLSDLILTLENDSKTGTQKGNACKKCAFYDSVKDLSFYDYAQKYLLIDNYKSPEQLNYDTSLYCLKDFLQKNEKYKIYHTLDDYYANKQQLGWLKTQAKNKAVIFSNGSHLGFLYRKEFMDEFKKDISLQDTTQQASNEDITPKQ